MNLTPKQKARQLVERYYLEKSKDNSHLNILWKQAKGCSLICVDEIIKIAPSDKSIFGTQYLTIKEYYQQVKNEIENL